MILNLDYVFEKYKPHVSGIIHIGGHYGNEISKYKEHNVENVILFEPLSSNFEVLQKTIKEVGGNIIAHKVALGNDNKKVTMNISDNDAQSSSILTPKVHLTAHPEVLFVGTEEVQMDKLDDYDCKKYNMAIIDVQGYELEVLRGGSKTLQNVDYIYCEVNRDEVYEGNARIEEIDEFLLSYGFERVETQWYFTEVWGDAFYIKKEKKSMKGEVSLICACKNRYNALKLSLNSWVMFDEVKEILIVDWSSDEPIDDLLEIDDRIKIIRVDGKEYFNLSQPLNLAASFATGDYILKVDCDYLINPYYNFFEDHMVDQKSFLSGNPSYKNVEAANAFWDYGSTIDLNSLSIIEIADYVNTYSHYFKYLKGLLFVSRENFLKVGGFDEDIQSYGWEDGEIIKRLEKLNLEHKKLSFDYRIMHIPHPDRKRFEHCKDYDIKDENYFTDIMRDECTKDELPFQVDYALVSHLITKNKKSLLENNKLIFDSSSDYQYSSNSDYYTERKTKWEHQEIKPRYYLSTEKIEDMNFNLEIEFNKNKLDGFPSVHYVTLEESRDRQESLESQFGLYGIKPKAIKSKRFADSEDKDKVIGKYVYQLNDGTKGCCVSHLKAIKEWYDTTNEDYGFFCEDDLSLETIQMWNFTWEQFIEKIPEDADCVQLFTVRDNFDTFELRERYWDDWGVTAYILTRDYAERVIESYIKGDEYHLEIENQEVMPLIENIIFSSGKTYTIPIFVEDLTFDSTFVGYDDDVKGGHKTNHKVARNLVVKYWTQYVIKSNEKKTELEDLLLKFSLDTENPDHNFNLGIWYEKEGHTAPALSYFLRCAERAEDHDLAYEALIRGSYCYEKQGERDGSSRSLLFQAQAFRPDRPEAYFLLSKYAEKRQWWQDCYLNADLALRYCDFNQKPLRTDIEYPGRYGLLFEKAVSGWWWGKSDESKSIFLEILSNYEITENYYKSISKNLIEMGVENFGNK
jgi:FkbM family methyltransferase